MSIYKLSAVVTGADNIAAIDIREEGSLYAVSISMRPGNLDALGDYMTIEISFGSTSSLDSNDVLSSIFQHVVTQNFLTSGGGVGSNTASISGLLIPVHGGERIYMHARIVAGTGRAEAYLYVDDNSDPKPIRRRR